MMENESVPMSVEEEYTDDTRGDVPEGSVEGISHTTNNNAEPVTTYADNLQDILAPGFVTPDNSPPPYAGIFNGAVHDSSVTPDTPRINNEEEAQLNRVQALFNNIFQHTSNVMFSHTSSNSTSLVTSSPSIHSPVLATGVQTIPVYVSNRRNVASTRFQYEPYRFCSPSLPITTASNIHFQSAAPNARPFHNIQTHPNTSEAFRFSAPQLMHPYARSWQPASRMHCAIPTLNNTSQPSIMTSDIFSSASSLVDKPMLTSTSQNKSTGTVNASESDLMKPVTCSAQHLDFKNMQPTSDLGSVHMSQASALAQDTMLQSIDRIFQSQTSESATSSPQRQQVEQSPPTFTFDGLFGSNTTSFLNDTEDVRFVGPTLQPQILLQQSSTVIKDKESQRLRNTINKLLTEKSHLTKELKDTKESLDKHQKSVKSLKCDINKLYNEKNHLQDKINRYKEKLEKAQLIQDAAFKLTLECGKLQASNQCLKLQNDRLAKDIDALFEFFAKKRRRSQKGKSPVDVINELDKKENTDEEPDDETDDEEDDEEDEDSEDDLDEEENEDDHDNNDDGDDFEGARGSGGGGTTPPHSSSQNADTMDNMEQGHTQNTFSYERITDNQLSQVKYIAGNKRKVKYETRYSNNFHKTGTKEKEAKYWFKDNGSQWPFKQDTKAVSMPSGNMKCNLKDKLGSQFSIDEPLLKKMKYTILDYPLSNIQDSHSLLA